jgi:hypothetical protein
MRSSRFETHRLLDGVEEFNGVLDFGFLPRGLLGDLTLDGQGPAVTDLLESLQV